MLGEDYRSSALSLIIDVHRLTDTVSDLEEKYEKASTELNEIKYAHTAMTNDYEITQLYCEEVAAIV